MSGYERKEDSRSVTNSLDWRWRRPIRDCTTARLYWPFDTATFSASRYLRRCCYIIKV